MGDATPEKLAMANTLFKTNKIQEAIVAYTSIINSADKADFQDISLSYSDKGTYMYGKQLFDRCSCAAIRRVGGGTGNGAFL